MVPLHGISSGSRPDSSTIFIGDSHNDSASGSDPEGTGLIPVSPTIFIRKVARVVMGQLGKLQPG